MAFFGQMVIGLLELIVGGLHTINSMYTVHINCKWLSSNLVGTGESGMEMLGQLQETILA